MDIFHMFSKKPDFQKQAPNTFNIFFILTGEGIKHPRSIKFLQIYESLSNEQRENMKIVITGKSGFDFYRRKIEAKELANFLLSFGIPSQDIILEKQAMDTVGNMVFSYEIIVKEIEEIRKRNSNCNIIINLITEGFHMGRSRELFECVFGNFLKTQNNVGVNFISSYTQGIKLRLYKKLPQKTLRKFLKRENIFESEIGAFFKRIEQLIYSYGKDDVIHTFIDIDIKRFQLYSYQRMKEYLFSMPVYNSHYTSRDSDKFKYSLYALMIRKHLHLS